MLMQTPGKAADFDLPHRRLSRGADRGGVRRSWFQVARLVAVLPRPGWRDRADLGRVGIDAYPVRLVRAFLYLRLGSCSRPFSLAQQFDVADGDGSFSHQHLHLLYDGRAALGPN